VVFEELYSVRFLQRRPLAALLLGIAYTVIGMVIAIFTFPEDPALVAVAITSILFIPSLHQLTREQETAVRKRDEKSWFGTVASLLRLSKSSALVYLFAFIGMFATFAFFSLSLPQLATNVLFKQQLEVFAGPTGQALAFSGTLLVDLLRNNILVLLLCFIISLIAGNGSILFIAWNASVWGTFFATLARTAATQIEGSPVILLIIILFSVVPHMLLEISSYILAAISGSVLSDGIASEKFNSAPFSRVMNHALALLALAGLVLIIGMIVETLVLNNFDTYARIVELSFGAA